MWKGIFSLCLEDAQLCYRLQNFGNSFDTAIEITLTHNH